MLDHTTTITISIAFIATTQQISYNIDHPVLKPESQCSPKKRRCLCLELVEVIFEHSLHPIFILAKSFSSSTHNHSYIILPMLLNLHNHYPWYRQCSWLMPHTQTWICVSAMLTQHILNGSLVSESEEPAKWLLRILASLNVGRALFYLLRLLLCYLSDLIFVIFLHRDFLRTDFSPHRFGTKTA